MDINYQRVLPRDLFNESKLLKCIGRLVLLIEDDMLEGVTYTYHDDNFDVRLMNDGHLYINNIWFKIHSTRVIFKTTYNSKENYSLLCEYDFCEYLVFEENGEVTEEFKTFCNDLKQ